MNLKQKRFLLAVFAIALLGGVPFSALAAEVSNAEASDRGFSNSKTDDFGLGVKWGYMTGATAKYWVNEMRAFEATVAFSNGDSSIAVDHLWHFRTGVYDVTSIRKSENFVPFIGLGLVGAFGLHTGFFNKDDSKNLGLAARIPLGFEYLPKSTRLGLFAAMNLGFEVVPTADTFFTADVGARYYF